MPIDNKIENRSFEELFEHPIRFEVPFFQRAYSWKRQQWKQLFDDIWEQIISDAIDQIQSETGDERISEGILEEHLREHEHYFGAIVVLEKTNADPALKSFTIVDGQQRITTVYLLLSLISHILKEKSSEYAERCITALEGYTKNNIDPKGDDYRKLKVFSNKGDRLPTYYIIFNNENPESPSLPIDQQLYVQGQNQIEVFCSYAYKKLRVYDVTTLWVFSQAILRSLKIVWIPLDENKDDPQAIFEGLNDKGMVLSAVELLCSYLFKPLIDDITRQHESIHNDKWLKSIKKVGGEDKFEFYLRNLFSINRYKMIGKGRKLYSQFKNTDRNISKQKAFETINEISDNADIFNQIDQPLSCHHPNGKIHSLLKKIKQTGMASSIPFVLAVLKELKASKISENDTIIILKNLLVLLIRRKVCELKTTKYDVFFPTLLNKIINEPDKAKAFQDQVRQESLWVSDQEFKDSFINKPLYKQTELEFARLILQEIDGAMQEDKQLPDYSSINTIEHVLPQTLDDEWRNYLGNEAFDMNLERIRNTIGNLCLVSPPANSRVGQDSFERKKNRYTDVSALTRDLKQRTGKWDIGSIKKRSKDLAQKALEIWTFGT